MLHVCSFAEYVEILGRPSDPASLFPAYYASCAVETNATASQANGTLLLEDHTIAYCRAAGILSVGGAAAKRSTRPASYIISLPVDSPCTPDVHHQHTNTLHEKVCLVSSHDSVRTQEHSEGSDMPHGGLQTCQTACVVDKHAH